MKILSRGNNYKLTHLIELANYIFVLQYLSEVRDGKISRSELKIPTAITSRDEKSQFGFAKSVRNRDNDNQFLSNLMMSFSNRKYRDAVNLFVYCKANSLSCIRFPYHNVFITGERER